MEFEQLSLPTQVESIIKSAGEIILSYFHHVTIHEEKKTGGIVTKADLESEHYLKEQLNELMPGAFFIGEELGNRAGSTDYCWVIDPLDGTTNFVHGIPYFCISIALTFKDVPVFGAIYQPMTKEYFWAQKDKGAFLNDQKITVSTVDSLEQSVPVVGFPYKKERHFDNLLKLIDKIAPKTYAFRHFGAAALDQAYVACGRLDAVLLENLGWWDVAAGMLIISQAGGIVTNYEGKTVDPHYETFIAAGPSLYPQLRALVGKS